MGRNAIWKATTVLFALSTAGGVLWSQRSRPNPLSHELVVHCHDVAVAVRDAQAQLRKPAFSPSEPPLQEGTMQAIYRETLFCDGIHRADDETRKRWEGPIPGVAVDKVEQALIHIDVSRADDPAQRKTAADALDPLIALIDEIDESPLR